MPPTPLRCDDFFSDGDTSLESPSKTPLTRPSDLSLAQTTSTSSSDPPTVAPGPASNAKKPPIVGPEDTTLQDAGNPLERPDNNRLTTKQRKMDKDPTTAQAAPEIKENAGNGKEEEEEEEEMTQDRLRSLLQDIQLEGGVEEEEMTEEKVHAILEQVRQAEKDLSSVAGWTGETSGAFGESAAVSHNGDGEEGRCGSISPPRSAVHFPAMKPGLISM